ncbi:MAG TPA: hypothetical protein VJ806_09470 [Luteimonas sp.]|nr:hypothetical protein [Luteimonas sp.]
MRGMLFLLLGFAVVLVLGMLALPSGPSPQEGAQPPTMGPVAHEPTDWALIGVLLIASWATAFLQRPFWLSLLLSVAVAGFGTLLVLGGALAGYADSYLRPSYKGAWPLFWCGVAMVASRIVTLYLWFRKYPEELAP